MVGSALKRDNINGDAREHKPVKYSVLRWRGIIPESNTLLRCSFMLLLTIGILSLSFTQLGFVSIGKTSSYFCYAIVLLAPVSAAALLGAAVGILDRIHPMRLAPDPCGTAWGSCNPGRS